MDDKKFNELMVQLDNELNSVEEVIKKALDHVGEIEASTDRVCVDPDEIISAVKDACDNADLTVSGIADIKDDAERMREEIQYLKRRVSRMDEIRNEIEKAVRDNEEVAVSEYTAKEFFEHVAANFHERIEGALKAAIDDICPLEGGYIVRLMKKKS